MSYPSALDTWANMTNQTLQLAGHLTRHNDLQTAIIGLETKVGINSSAVQTTHDYKLSGVTTGDKAVSLTGSEVLTNKTLTNPTVTTGTFTSPTLNTPTFSQGAVGGADLSTSAITLGYASIAADQSGITTIVDITGLSVTVTVPAGGRRVKITGQVCGFDNGIDTAALYIKEGTTVLQSSFTQTVNNQPYTPTAIAIVTPIAGSHTYKLSAAVTAGGNTMSILATDTTHLNFILVELI